MKKSHKGGYDKTMAEEKETKKKLSKLEKILETVDETRRPIAKKLYKRCKFMEATLNALEKKIKEEGAVIVNRNGNGFEVQMENPAQKSYTALVGKYNAVIKNLLDMIPKNEAKDDEFTEFFMRKKR